MDFLDPKKKRAHHIRLYIGYVLMAIVLAIGSYMLLMEAYGYDVSRKTGGLIHNGMVFVDAHPEEAQVYLNGERETTTRARLVLPEGKYTVEMIRDGYRAWKRTFQLVGSKIERLDYAFLFPSQLDQEDVQLYTKTPTFATQSPDRRWLVVLRPGSTDTFEVTDLRDSNNATKTITLPKAILAAAKGAHSYEVIEWSNDNRHFIVRHAFTGGFEFLMFDHEQPERSYNINKRLSMKPAQVSMRGKKFDELHVLDKVGGTLRFVDVASGKRETVLSHVHTYKSYGDNTLLYVTDAGAGRGKVEARVLYEKSVYRMRSMTTAKSYLLDVSRYKDGWYFAVATGAEKQAFVYSDFLNDVTANNVRLPGPIAALRLNTIPQHMSFSANTRFVSIQAGSEFSVYDAEHDRQYRYDTKLKVDPTAKAVWMDGHRFMMTSEGNLHVFDYDGINQQTLVSSFMPQGFFDRDYDNLYTIGKSPLVTNRSSLARTSMRIPADR